VGQLRGHAVDVVCGLLLGGALLAQLVAQSLAADFCFTERSAVKADGLFGTRYELPPAHGDLGAGYFAQQHLPLAAVLREDYELWTPAACPICMVGQPLEDAGVPAV
jgi:hypothetical protein